MEGRRRMAKIEEREGEEKRGEEQRRGEEEEGASSTDLLAVLVELDDFILVLLEALEVGREGVQGYLLLECLGPCGDLVGY